MQAKAPADAVGWRVDVCENGRREWRTGLVVAVVTNGRGGSGGGDNTRDRVQVVFDSGARGVVSLKNDAVRYLEYTGKNASAVGVTLATAGDFSFLSGVMQQLSMEGKT